MAYELTYSLINNKTEYEISGYTGTPDVVDIPSTYNGKSVTSIGSDAFYECTSLTSVVIPDSVTSIKQAAFMHCTSLTSITIPDSVTSIGGFVFSGCTSLKYNEYDNAYYLGNKNNLYRWLIEAKNTSITSVNIHENTKFIGYDAFEYCRSLTSVTIPDSVTSIGSDAFYYCDSLTSVTIPDSVTTIGSNVFAYCTSLTSVTISNSLTSIGSSMFKHCDKLTSVTIPDSVTTISSSAFLDCTSLTSVTIPNNVTSIGNYVFDNCTSLKYNEYDNAYYLGNKNNPYVLLIKAKNKSITSVNIHDNTKIIYASAFSGCISLKSITIPDSVNSICDYAFEFCTKLKSVNIPDSVTTIGNRAFSDCDSLNAVYITDLVAWYNISFGSYLANPLNCANNLYLNGQLVTEVVIPEGITSINSSVFYNCTSLMKVTIPNSVTIINTYAFSGCTNLMSVTLLSTTPPSLSSNSFNNISEDVKFYCVSSVLDTYKTSTNWNTYADNFVTDDLRLYFIMNANSQKNYVRNYVDLKASKYDGSGENSIVVGEGSNAIGGSSTALGYYVTSGAKAYDFDITKSLDYAENQPEEDITNNVGRYYLTSNEGLTDLAAGDVYSVILSGNWDFQGTIAGYNDDINDCYIIVDNYIKPTATDYYLKDENGNDIKYRNTKVTTSSYILIVDKPLIGNKVIGTGTVALGYSNKAEGVCSASMGYNNTSAGKYSFSAGRDNKAGYCAAVFGQQSEALGHNSFASGVRAKAHAHYSSAIGYNNTIQSGATYGVCLGTGLVVTDEAQTVVGRYNKEADSKGCVFVVGGGEGTGGRSKTALSVTPAGDLKIAGSFTNNGDAQIKGTFNAMDQLVVEQGITTLTDAGQLNVNGATILNGTLTANNIVTIEGNTTLNGTITANGYLNAESGATLKGTTNINGTLVVSGEITTGGKKVYRIPTTGDLKNTAASMILGTRPLKDSEGNVTGYAESYFSVAASGTSSNSIAQRDSTGCIRVAEPTLSNHTATKKYVDDLIKSALSKSY